MEPGVEARISVSEHSPLGGTVRMYNQVASASWAILTHQDISPIVDGFVVVVVGDGTTYEGFAVLDQVGDERGAFVGGKGCGWLRSGGGGRGV